MIRFLQQESRITKLIFAVFISIVVIFMVITLVPGIFDMTGGNADTYATIHAPMALGLGRFFGSTEDVKTQQVQQMAQRIMQQQRLPPMYASFVIPQAAQSLVQQAMLVQQADKLGLKVSDDDLRRELHQGQLGEALFPNGKYIGDDAYASLVQDNFGVSKTQFESLVKKDMEIARLQALVTGGINVPDQSVKDEYRKQGTKIKFDYAVLSSADLRKEINPTDAELQQYFKQNAARYAKADPETRKIKYMAFDYNQIPGGQTQVTPAELQAYYNQHQDQFKVQDSVRVRHILIAVPQGAPAQADAAAKAKAEGLLNQIRSGADFAELAKKNSDDPGSKDKGGELGFIQHGTTVPEFDKTAFSQNPGQTSDLVKTRFGYHIIQTEEKQTAHTKPLDEVKMQILPSLERQKQQAAAQNFANQLSQEVQKQGFEKTAEQHKLQVVTTDYLAQGGMIAGLADPSQLVTAAMEAKPNGTPGTANTGDGMAVFQVVDVKPAHAPTFEEYKPKLVEAFRDEHVPALLQKKTAELADKARQENDLKKAAAEVGATVKTSDLVDSNGQVPEIGSMKDPGMAAAFAMNVGQISGPINTGHSGVVLKLLDKQVPSDADVAKNFDQTRDQMVGEQREQVFRLYVSNLMDQYTKHNLIRYNKRAEAGLQQNSQS